MSPVFVVLSLFVLFIYIYIYFFYDGQFQ